MAMIRSLLLVAVLVGSTAHATVERNNGLGVADIIASHGYPSENHHVTTSDGYILGMHRIPHGRTLSPTFRRPAVFVMHGLYGDSQSFILLGPELAIPYNLADAGFDVWMGNSRGNRHSRSHLTLDPDDNQEKFDFFDFSFEDIALYDVSAMIDYILSYTGQEKVHYIGHSQGGTVFLVLMSMKPEYNEKVHSVHLLAGVGYQDYFPSSELSLLATFTTVIYNMALAIGFVEVFPPSLSGNDRGIKSCAGDADKAYMCEAIGLREIMTDEDVLEGYSGGGGSLKQLAHYGQNIRDSTFRRWSFGIIQNTIVYGSSSPPAFDLSLITANVTMHYTVNDVLLDEKDVLAMANDMPNTVVRRIARDSFSHTDFIGADDAKELVTDYIIEVLREVSAMPEELEALESEEVDEENAIIEGGTVLPVPGSAHSLVISKLLKLYLIILALTTLLHR